MGLEYCQVWSQVLGGAMEVWVRCVPVEVCFWTVLGCAMEVWVRCVPVEVCFWTV